jgi:hypothetical protein
MTMRAAQFLMGLAHRFQRAALREPEHTDDQHRLIYMPLKMPEDFHG